MQAIGEQAAPASGDPLARDTALAVRFLRLTASDWLAVALCLQNEAAVLRL
jgi:hypothetical protein